MADTAGDNPIHAGIEAVGAAIGPLVVGHLEHLVRACIQAPGMHREDRHVVPAPDATVQFFAVRYADTCADTSMLYLHDGVAGIYCVATRPEERGKGLGVHATAEPLRLAHGRGYRVGVLQSSPAGYSVYQRLGSETTASCPCMFGCRRRPPDVPCPGTRGYEEEAPGRRGVRSRLARPVRRSGARAA